MQQDRAAEVVLERLEDLENNPDEQLAPYEEFEFDGNTYYFTPGGFLYRKGPWSDEVGGFFCGYLTDEAWHHRTDEGWRKRYLLLPPGSKAPRRAYGAAGG